MRRPDFLKWAAALWCGRRDGTGPPGTRPATWPALHRHPERRDTGTRQPPLDTSGHLFDYVNRQKNYKADRRSAAELSLNRSRGAPHRPSQRTCRQYPDQNTTGPEHDGHSGRGTCTARPIDAYASTVSGHGHTMDMGESPPPIPSREGTQTRREGITALSNRFTTILNLAADPCSPHHQRTRPEPAEDAQPIRPSTGGVAPGPHDAVAAADDRASWKATIRTTSSGSS